MTPEELEREKLKMEVHFWRSLLTPIRLELRMLQRRHPEIAAEVGAILKLFYGYGKNDSRKEI